jgi:hypothetical protein
MELLLWIGTAISLLGLGGLVYCIFAALRAKRRRLEDSELRARLKRLTVWNLGALMLSSLGLIVVITGLFLR